MDGESVSNGAYYTTLYHNALHCTEMHFTVLHSNYFRKFECCLYDSLSVCNFPFSSSPYFLSFFLSFAPSFSLCFFLSLPWKVPFRGCLQFVPRATNGYTWIPKGGTCQPMWCSIVWGIQLWVEVNRRRWRRGMAWDKKKEEVKGGRVLEKEGSEEEQGTREGK